MKSYCKKRLGNEQQFILTAHFQDVNFNEKYLPEDLLNKNRNYFFHLFVNNQNTG